MVTRTIVTASSKVTLHSQTRMTEVSKVKIRGYSATTINIEVTIITRGTKGTNPTTSINQRNQVRTMMSSLLAMWPLLESPIKRKSARVKIRRSLRPRIPFSPKDHQIQTRLTHPSNIFTEASTNRVMRTVEASKLRVKMVMVKCLVRNTRTGKPARLIKE